MFLAKFEVMGKTRGQGRGDLERMPRSPSIRSRASIKFCADPLCGRRHVPTFRVPSPWLLDAPR